MAFGRLTTKFRIFRGKMAYEHKKITRIFSVSCMLHNFIIDNDTVDVDYEDRFVEHQGAFMHGVAPVLVADQVVGPDPLAYSSIRRSRLVELISQDPQLTRPLRNLIRNADINN